MVLLLKFKRKIKKIGILFFFYRNLNYTKNFLLKNALADWSYIEKCHNASRVSERVNNI